MGDAEGKQAEAEAAANTEGLATRYDADAVKRCLETLGVEFQCFHHAPVDTVAQNQGLDLTIPGVHVKNLFLRDKKYRLYLVTCEETRDVPLKALRRWLGAAHSLTFCTPDILKQELNVNPGSVTPLALANIAPQRVRFVMDRALEQAELVNPHPLRSDQTLGMAPAGLIRFIKHFGHAIEWLHFPDLADLDRASGV